MILFCNEIPVIKSIGRYKEVDLKRNHRKKVVYGKGRKKLSMSYIRYNVEMAGGLCKEEK